MLRGVSRPLLLALVGLLVVGLAFTASHRGGKADNLREAARSLVPPGGHIVAREAGACVEFAAFPSCETVWFRVRGRSLDERARLVGDRAERLGWEPTGSTGGDGGTILRFHKGRLSAYV